MWGLSLDTVGGSYSLLQCAGFSLCDFYCKAWVSAARASVVACGLGWVVAHGCRCSMTWGIFLVSLALQSRFLTTGSPGKPWIKYYFLLVTSFIPLLYFCSSIQKCIYHKPAMYWAGSVLGAWEKNNSQYFEWRPRSVLWTYTHESLLIIKGVLNAYCVRQSTYIYPLYRIWERSLWGSYTKRGNIALLLRFLFTTMITPGSPSVEM